MQNGLCECNEDNKIKKIGSFQTIKVNFKTTKEKINLQIKSIGKIEAIASLPMVNIFNVLRKVFEIKQQEPE